MVTFIITIHEYQALLQGSIGTDSQALTRIDDEPTWIGPSINTVVAECGV